MQILSKLATDKQIKALLFSIQHVDGICLVTVKLSSAPKTLNKAIKRL